MEGKTNCVFCEFKSKSIGSLKQHMESRHNVFNMTIVQVQESEIKSKEELIKNAEVDLNVSKEALKREK